MNSDFDFFKGVDDAIHMHVKSSSEPTYYYMFAHRPQFSLQDLLQVPSDFDLGTEEIF